MNLGDKMNPQKLEGYMERIWNTAKAHGWHETPLSAAHYLGLVMTEMAEAVEADRKGKRANTEAMADVIRTQSEGEIGLTQEWYENWFGIYYQEYVKGSIEEEFADVVIRILDMAYGLYGKKMYYSYYPSVEFRANRSFVENAWFFIKAELNFGYINISNSVAYMYAWAKQLGIDLDQHIEWKMKYNEMRPYKHGGKKY